MAKGMWLLAGVSLAECLSPAGVAPALADEPVNPDIIVRATPLSGEADEVGNAKALETTHAVSVAEHLARTAPGVTINEIQGNPLQPDVNYRGLTASPLLGTAQGLSVYLDGVRVNQPFGDVVSWDLIPTGALADVDLVSGAAPQFGRNALGGALVLRSKSGKTDPGVLVEASAGSFGRVTGSVAAGGVTGSGVDWFVTADHFREDGWRDLSPSRATRALAKLGWSDAASALSLTGHFADTNLNGNGLQEMRLLAADRRSIYTAPDNTRNRMGMVVLNGETSLAGGLHLRGNAFWRHIRTTTYNGDVNDDALGENLYQPNGAEQAALTAAGYTGFPTSGETQANTPFPKWRCIANVLLNSEPNEKCDGLVNRSQTRQSEWGATLEASATLTSGPLRHDLTLGGSYVGSTAHFTQSTQFGYLLPDRTVVAVAGPGAFADGTQDSENAYDARVDLRARSTVLSAYALDHVALGQALSLDLAARYDRVAIRNRDAITPGGGTGSLDSSPVYQRVNPAVTLTGKASDGTTLSVAWSQASRAPSAVELGCSDPESPCRLPNALAGDPPLRQVVARTLELRLDAGNRWGHVHASLFRTQSSDDILFVANDASGYGYFRNFGKTRRQGVELSADARLHRFTFSASYTLLDATYQSREVVNGSGNSSSDAEAPGFEGNITIRRGDRIPLLARHTAKAAIGWEAANWLTINLDMVAVSGVYARGNENNAHQADGVYYLGPGKTDPYAVFNLGVEARPHARLTVFATVRNLFDKDYATAAQLGATAFDGQGRVVSRPFAGPVIDGERPLVNSTFLAPGAPRSLQVGARLRF
ncbi:TonB-dependent receptor [Novosphingobium sp. SG720]|uniref:TonB-dependent receptor n=1 Tax=Novosphingobium sp. SG720 TaxID=2586998 RepID=UPI0014469BCF|nr:TonB-dependent receptor [Novosphingobium sp. SG720]NKJ42051.1 outer membrane receptor protein involved in Fe transport [Novosphingobium sp. SG720]